jgi:hypothetical protein
MAGMSGADADELERLGHHMAASSTHHAIVARLQQLAGETVGV